ncbi:MAG: hypothetical protein WAN50_00245 [Minisyncoccia bacterium]
MARPKGATNKKKAFVNTLGDAVRFISCAQRPLGNDVDTHCMMFNKWIVATNGVLTAAHAIQDDMRICPHTMMLLAAMDSCTGPYSMTQESDAGLWVVSGDFRAFIPCVTPTALPMMAPDAPVALVDVRFLDSLAHVASLVADNATTVLQASIQLCGRSVRATDTEVIVESWHGIDMPPGLLIPKSAANALLKCGKKPVRFGVSQLSLTFWYEDNSWIKTQLFTNTELPDMDRILNVASNPWPTPKGLFEAAASIAPFSTNGLAKFADNGVMKTDNADTDLLANMTVAGLPAGLSFKFKNLKSIAAFAKQIDFTASPKFALFFGDNVRGAIAKYVTPDTDEVSDDDIPPET